MFLLFIVIIAFGGVSIFIPEGTLLTKILFSPEAPVGMQMYLGTVIISFQPPLGETAVMTVTDSGPSAAQLTGQFPHKLSLHPQGTPADTGHMAVRLHPGWTHLPPPTLAFSPLCAARAAGQTGLRPAPPPPAGPGDHAAPLPSQLRKQVLRKMCFPRNVDAGYAFSLPKVLGSHTWEPPSQCPTQEPSDGPPASGQTSLGGETWRAVPRLSISQTPPLSHSWCPSPH